MSAMVPYTFKLPQKTKTEIPKLAEKYGLTAAQLLRATMHQLITGRLTIKFNQTDAQSAEGRNEQAAD